MFTAKARLLVAIIVVLLLGYTLYARIYELSIVAACAIVWLIWGYYRQGPIVLAAKEYRRQNYELTAQLLAEIKDPDKLAKNRRGYYEFMLGNLCLKKQDYDQAEQHFQIASRFPLKNENDKAFVLVNLANINLRKKDKERVLAYTEKARTLRITSRVKDIIEKIEREAKQLD